MKKFELLNTLDPKYKRLVVATSYEDPLEVVDRIEIELKQEGYNGKILFDMLGYIGDNSERFLSCVFTGEHFDLSTLSVQNIEKTSNFRQITCQHFRKQNNSLDLTILTNLQKRLILQGIAI